MRPHHLFDIRGLLAVAILLVAMPAHAQFCFDANGPLVPGAGERANAVAIGDLDGDGLADVVTANDATDRVAVLRQLAGGTLDTAVLWATGDEPVSLALADLDGDTDLDVVTGDQTSGAWSVLWNDGAGGLAERDSIPSGPAVNEVRVADLDGDGHLDL